MKLRLKGKIALIIISGISVLSAFFVIVTTISFQEKVTGEFNGRVVSLGENLSEVISGPLLTALSFGDEELSPEILQTLRIPLDSIVQQDDIDYAALFLKDKSLIQSVRKGIAESRQESQNKTGEKLCGKYDVYEVVMGNETVLEIRMPVKNLPDAKISFGYSDARINATKKTFMFKAVLIGLGGICVMSILTIFFVNKTVIKPLSAVTHTAVEIANGKLKQEQIRVKSTDEIGQLADAFNTMLEKLNLLVRQAEEISAGHIGSEEMEKAMLSGKNSNKNTCETNGDLETAFARMRHELQKMTIQARRIAEDDIYNNILEQHITGELGEAFTHMTAHFRTLSEATQKIAEGNLTVKLNSKNGNKGLTNSFTQMVYSLKEIILSINNSAAEFNKALNSLASIAAQSSENSADLNIAMEQIAKASNEVASSVQKASSSSSVAQQLSGKGQNLLNDLLVKIDLIKKSMESSLENVHKLSKRSQNISEIIDIITDISDQTNLLALNAAIEAARAGDAGKGFAVVASEVKKLADSSHQQTARIALIIKDIVEDTRKTQSSSETVNGAILEGTQLVKSINSLFTDTNTQINNVAFQIEQIAANAEETSASTEEISAQAEEQTQAAQKVYATVEQLRNSTALLSKSTERFTLE